MNKLCGCKEDCFVRGEQWGHFEGVMCKHLSEDGVNSLCDKTNEVVNCYTTQQEYEELKCQKKYVD